MKLYLVRGNDVGGENQDWFVVAADPDRAILMWNDIVVSNGFPRDEGDDEEALPWKRRVEPDNVREIVDVKGTRFDGPERGVEWTDMTIVA